MVPVPLFDQAFGNVRSCLVLKRAKLWPRSKEYRMRFRARQVQKSGGVPHGGRGFRGFT